MTDEQKRRKILELEQLLSAADAREGYAQSNIGVGMDLDLARQLMKNLRRQLNGEVQPARGYHVSRTRNLDPHGNGKSG